MRPPLSTDRGLAPEQFAGILQAAVGDFLLADDDLSGDEILARLDVGLGAADDDLLGWRACLGLGMRAGAIQG